LTAHPNDPAASGKAIFSILIPFLGAIAALGPLSNDLYVPSLSLVSAGLRISGGAAQLTMSSLLIGFSFGCLLYGPLSDRYGRKPILCLGLGVYMLAAVLAALSSDLAHLVAARALQGFGASSGMVLSRAIILDRWTGEEASRAISWVSIFTFFTPVIAPLVGGYVATFGHWPAVFWLQAAAGGLSLAVTLGMLPRVRRSHVASVVASMRAYGGIVADGQALGYMLCTGLAFIGVVAFVSNSSFVLTGQFDLEPHQYGYSFSFVMLGGSIGAYTNSRFVTRFGISRMLGIGSTLLATGGTLALLAAGADLGLVTLLLACLVYVFGVGFVFANAVARTMSRFPQSRGAASAVFGVNQFLIGGIVAALLSLVREPSPLPLAATMAFAGLACAVVWWGWLGRLPVVRA
jgi:DHA1 family bicyclomycin/chloramphenicol resistance-like MFS transporter